jgi:voltage-gated potassium channel
LRQLVFHCVAIGLGIGALAASTVHDATLPIRPWAQAILWICLALFMAELLYQLWLQWRDHRKLAYFCSVPGAIDVMAALPIPVALLCGMGDDAWLLASLWMLKLIRFVPGISVLGRVIALEARPLGSVFVIFLIVLVFSSVCLFLLESPAQPSHFGNLPLAFWWAVTTLTTTGYGDAVPHTFLGRLIAGFVMICGLAVFGLWTGILTSGFANEHRRRDFLRNWQLMTRVPLFRNLDPTAAIEIARMLRPIDLDERTVVIRQGKPGDCMYFIASGEVEVRLEPKPLRLGPGDFFGELALLEGGPRTATVATTAPSTLLVLGASEFRAFAAVHPEVTQTIEREAARRMHEVR